MGRLKFIIDDSYLLATEQLNYELDTFLANILVVQLHHRYDQGHRFKDLGGMNEMCLPFWWIPGPWSRRRLNQIVFQCSRRVWWRFRLPLYQGWVPMYWIVGSWSFHLWHDPASTWRLNPVCPVLEPQHLWSWTLLMPPRRTSMWTHWFLPHSHIILSTNFVMGTKNTKEYDMLSIAISGTTNL